MRILLVRHGESEGNAQGIIQGHQDFGLSPLGELQARTTAAHLGGAKVAAIVTSPLRRAAMTAEAIALGTGLVVEELPELMEYDIGAASGLTWVQIRERYPELAAAWARGERRPFPGEEGRDVFHARIARGLAKLREREGTVAAVAHGGVINAICIQVLGIPPHRRGVFSVHNCSITEIVTDRTGSFLIQRQNDTCHLRGLVTTADRG